MTKTETILNKGRRGLENRVIVRDEKIVIPVFVSGKGFAQLIRKRLRNRILPFRPRSRIRLDIARQQGLPVILRDGGAGIFE